MTLDKSIQHGKEHRKPYHGAKAVDPDCRNKSCKACRMNRVHKNKRKEPIDESEEGK